MDDSPTSPSPKQPWLLPYVNPLTERIDPEFFRALPREPGVYVMIGASNDVLYVGKAKDLRARLLSYRRARPDDVSRKVIRMLNRVSRIEWDVCESEQAALLRENRLLRLHRPPFNVVNTHTDQYYLIGLESRGAQPRAFALFLTNRAAHKSDLPGNRLELFGAYKGRARARDGYAALLRLFWAAHSELPERFEYPTRLVRRIPPPRYDLRFPEQMPAKEASQWLRLVRQLLNGTSRALILKLTERLLEREGIPAFYHHFIQQDLNALEEFFRDSALRNKRLRKAHGLTTRVIPQDQIDDLIVASDSRVSGMPLANARRKTT